MDENIIYRIATNSDIDKINEFYLSVYNRTRTFEQFVWEFNESPAGKAIYIVAELNEEIIGTQCAIPYYIITDTGTEILSAKSEDTLVSPLHRGKHIFENMYKVLVEECKKNNISFLWGFTYAVKPFKKIGFEVPYKSTTGLLAIKPIQAADYFYSITAIKNFKSYLSIVFLTFFSNVKFWLLKINQNIPLLLDFNEVELNTSKFNYLKYKGLFGLKLNKAFIDYRINKNPYSVNYKTVNYKIKGVIKASVQYNVTKENVGFIINTYFENSLTKKEIDSFIRQTIFRTDLSNCSVVRYWGFSQNRQNKEEVELLKRNGFTFISRGISFVGLNLDHSKPINFSDFVLSRLASQGTD